jgi:mannose-6-phosphate isomerase-like protein (cupin superfamily)
MKKDDVISQLRALYPDKNLVCNPSDDPTEILCEIEPTSAHPEYSEAIAVVDSIAPHVHEITQETYTVISGTLEVYLNGEKQVVTEGESIVIMPGVVHYAKGNATWFSVRSQPGWTLEDHYLVEGLAR